ncbi:MAG TPA: hypothetical protein VMG98_13600 [Verrucomicrobiae bacterium]|nr:hypothetical protein [Verrucomicrobiae bacterium]
MRKFFGLLAIATMTACGGGGGGSTPNLPQATPTPTLAPVPTGDVRPTFTIVIPVSGGASKNRPGYVSSATQSISITLTEVNGTPPGALTGNPAITNINSTNCSGGCTVDGPPSPVGSDTFTLVTYDATGAAGNELSTSSGTYTMTQGVNNAETVTLEGIPATLTLAALPTTWSAGSTNSTAIGLTVADADGETITGTYANAVTVNDPDTNGDGTRVVSGSCPGTYPTGNTAIAATSAQFTSSASAATFCYGGLAQASVTLTASASGATSGTKTFSPIIAAPTSGTTTGAFVGTDAQLDTTTGTGSSGTIAYTEAGFTNAPYDQVLSVDSSAETCSTGGPLSTFASVSPAASGTTTVFTVVSASPYTAGKCSIPVWDGTGAYTPPAFSASYTTSSFTIDKKIH